ncbi:hypothetical protein MPH_04490 [Macrophomina phaseolina MS6]|uniref:Uncharacterized protein n=1 Tax=Macrophomina phaseolina (strain MS6) TaxID=1126212 RepID=K2SNB5_MACPH|nr:hypothetical protein MPH_04490 [Macrophomina phaseolina MS6]
MQNPLHKNHHFPRDRDEIEKNLIIALNLHLDGPRLRITRRLKRLNRILQAKPMRYQLLQINHTTRQQPNSPGPLVAVAVLELQVNLPGAQAHERDLDLALADANDEHLSAELSRLNSAGDAALDAGALHGDSRLISVHLLPNKVRKLFGRMAELDLVRAHIRHELLRELQPALIDIGNDEGCRAGRAAAQQGDQADGARPANEHGVAELDVGAGHAGEGDGEGF